jgi:hypothetical protein
MKTLEDLWQAITNRDFVWKLPLYYAIRKSTVYGDTIIDSGVLNRDEPWHLPMGISGTFDIDIQGEDIEPIQFKRHPINVRGNQTTINVPMMLVEIKDKFTRDNDYVRIEIYKIGVGEEPYVAIVLKTQRFKIPHHLRGKLNIVWRENNKLGRNILAKQLVIISDECLEYYVQFPDKSEVDLPF